jgi:hypothetical protein
MCMVQVMKHQAEKQHPGLRTGAFATSPANTPYTFGTGFPAENTPSEYLNNSAIGIAEKNRRKSLTPDQYGRALWSKEKSSTPKESAPPPVLRDNISTGSSDLKINKRKDRAQKRNVASGRRTSKAKRFSTRGK